MSRTALVAAAIMYAAAARGDEPLTIGSPAPKFEPAAFVRGEPVKGLAKGTVYVVEFSGTQCAPCLKCIPDLTAVQKKYKDVVLVSVYSGEPEDAVRAYVAKHGDKIGYRVATDPTGAVDKAWTEAALRVGIPDVFVVGADGRIAWIGRPWDMAGPLAQIIAGTFDPQRDAVRLKLEQRAEQQARRVRAREEKALEAYNRINAQIIAGKLTDALAATEAALKEYADAPEGIDRFRTTQLYLWVRLPGKKAAAHERAAELAVAAKLSLDVRRCYRLAGDLLNAADLEPPAGRDLVLIDLVIALLEDANDSLERYTHTRTKQYVSEARINLYWWLARARHLRGDHDAAVRRAEEAVELLKAAEPDPRRDPSDAKSEHAARLKRFTADVETYKKAAEVPKGK